MTNIHRSPYYYGTERDFKLTINGMKPIRGIKNVNEISYDWFIHPLTCTIVHLTRIDRNPPFEDKYVWTMTIYDPNAKAGFSTSGHKIVKIAGKSYPLHRLVALTFVENNDPKTKTIVYCTKGKRDIKAEHLIWVSPKELATYKRTPSLPLKLNLKPKNRS